ncbi:MAG: hypothetical protein GQ529_03710 [Methyloprofundus sp.]|nr:hypothetical protein [Methyloprofundus sp.]
MNSIKLSSVLVELNSQFLLIKASVVVTTHGTMLAKSFSLSDDKDDFSALISALNIFSWKTTKSLDYGRPVELYIQCTKETIIITETAGNLLLAVLVNSSDLFELDLSAVQKYFYQIIICNNTI